MLVLSTEGFDFALPRKLDRRVKYAGRMVDPDTPTWSSPWPSSDSRPLVLVTLSGLYRFQDEQVQQILDTLGELPVRVLVTVGPALDPDTMRAPSNAVVERWVPHEAVLPEAALVVTHGGHNTVLSAVVHGVPVLVMPLIPEQEWNGRRAEQLGMGRTLAPDAGPDDIRAVLAELLFDPHRRKLSRRAARAVGDRGRGGARAVTELERLAGRRL